MYILPYKYSEIYQNILLSIYIAELVLHEKTIYITEIIPQSLLE